MKIIDNTGAEKQGAPFGPASGDLTGFYPNPSIAANAVTINKILNSSISGNKIAANSISTGQIAANAVTSTEILNSSISGNKIAANSVLTGHIAANAVTSTEILNASISGNKVVANSILTGHLAANAVTSTEILNSAISGNKVAANSILFGHYATIPRARTASTINTIYPNNVQVDIAFNSVSWDTDSMWTGAQSGRLTANTAGVYIIVGNIIIAGGSNAGTRYAGITHNGTVTALQWQPPCGVDTQTINVSNMLNLAAGDIIKLVGYQDCGSNLSGLSIGYAPWLSMVRIG